jgi:hypothetical protein
MSGVALAGALLALVGLGAATLLLVRRTRRADRRIRRLEDEVRTLTARVDGVGHDARAAAMTARRAAAAAGVDDPPRVPLEPVTGTVVKAVAFSAGARRALARLADPRARRRSRAA